MGFSYKTLNSNDISLTSYIANKQWEVNNTTLSQNGVTIYIGENLPITRQSPFDPINDTETSNEESRRLIFASIKHLFYKNYISGSLTGRFFQSSSYFNYEQSTLNSGSIRNLPTTTGSIFNPNNPSTYEGALYDVSSSLYDETSFDPDIGSKIVVISIDKNIFGSGLSPNSVFISGSTYYLRDDGEGNIYDFITENNYLINQYPSSSIGNVFYSHGLIVLTDQDYLCIFGAPPTAVNDYYSYLNITPTYTLDVLSNDFADCGYLDYTSFTSTGGNFPNYTQNNGIITITPDQSSTIPGNYQLGYTIANTSGIRSNTGSINLTITSNPLIISNIISSSVCYGVSTTLPVTYSINYGVPFYSYSLDGINYTGVNSLSNVIISGSLIASNNNIIYAKDYLGEITTASFSSWYPEVTYATTTQFPCFSTSSNGKITIEGITGVSASLGTGSYFKLPKTFTGLTTGSYTVNVKDIYNCIVTSSVVLNTYPPLTASATLTNISCYGAQNGGLSIAFTNVIDSLRFNLQDPTGSYIYYSQSLSSFPNNTITASNLNSGSYNLYVYPNGDFCQSYTSSFTLTSATAISFIATASYIESCSNAVIFNATGGTPSYTYFAQNSSSLVLYSSDTNVVELDGTVAGIYNLFVRDSSSCTSPITTMEIYGRDYIYSGSNCEII